MSVLFVINSIKKEPGGITGGENMDKILRRAPWVFYLLLPMLFISIPIIDIVERIQYMPTKRFIVQ